MYPAPSNPRRAAETDSPLPPAPLHHAALSPTHFPYRIRTAYIFELCIWLRPAACGKIPFTRYFGRDFSRYYGLLFRFCWRLKPVPASSYLTVPFGAGGILPVGCSGSVHWSLNTVPVDSSEPLPSGTALLCPYTFSRLPNFQIMRCAIPTNRQSASLLCTLRLCMRTVSPWPCCAAPGFSGPRWTHSCRRTPEFSDLETTMRYTRQAPKTNPSICDHSMETAPAALPKQTRLQRTVAAHLEHGGS